MDTKWKYYWRLVVLCSILLLVTSGVRIRFGSGANGITTTLNPSDKGANIVLSGGNLSYTQGGQGIVRATIGKSSGKWYWEVKNTSGTNHLNCIGIANSSAALGSFLGIDAGGWGHLSTNSNNNGIYHSNAPLTPDHTATYVNNDIIMCALDMGAGIWWIGINGVWETNTSNVVGNPSAGTGGMVTGLTGTIYPAVGDNTNSAATVNFGASAFSYTVPTGFTAGFY